MAFFSFGADTKKEKSTSEGQFERSGTKQGEKRSRLELDQAAIEKIIGDVLGGPQGLASIFGGEQSAGIFDSSVAAQASGDLVANLIGELSKLTAEEVTSFSESETSRGTESGKSTGKSTGFSFGAGTGDG